MTSSEFLNNFSVRVFNDELGCDISLCGFCGNSGIVDTSKSAKWNDKCVGVITFCLCPNGRTLKKHNGLKDIIDD